MSDEKVGFGRPPKKHRFQKGRSGNPRGRPRKQLVPSDNSDAGILRRLDAEIVVVNGEGITKRELELRMLQAKALNGNLAAIKLIGELRRNLKLDKPPQRSGVLIVPMAPSQEEWELQAGRNQAKYRSAEYLADGALPKREGDV